MPEYLPVADTGDVDDFTRAYLECAEWSGIDEDERSDFDAISSPRWSDDALEQARRACDSFREVAGDLLDEIDDTQAGHDFWLTRNNHGAGFWSRDLGEVGDKLSVLASGYGEQYVRTATDTKELHLI